MTMTETLSSQVQRWLHEDPDPDTRAELEALLAAGDEATINERFIAPLAFGTAGLRAAMGAGPARMNRLVVRQAAAGLAAWLVDRGHADGLVVVGHDARHKSRRFAEDTARVMAAAGLRATLATGPIPTPVVAFALLHLGAVAAVQVTASHNPPQDNGYKVYASDGAQIVPPMDQEIEARIRVAASGPVQLEDLDHPLITTWGADVAAAYRSGVAELDPHTSTGEQRRLLKVVYTAMHGVGADTFFATMGAAGFTDVHAVPEQRDPDPDFPTVAFPNPEEPGALDLSLNLARTLDAELVLANDPDADRMAAAIPDPSAPGGWRALRGDEVGWLLADHLLTATAAMGSKRLVATTVVSSSLLRTIAEQHGVHYEETLTGFKWLARAALSHPELHSVLGYEEALGYSVGSLVRDKDGISAALVMADLAASILASGSTMAQRLRELADTYGTSLTNQWSVRFEGGDAQADMAALMTRLRATPPTTLDGMNVTSVVDLADASPAADVLVYRLGTIARVVIRPSGTEPKCKVYFEVLGTGDGPPSLAGLRASMEELLS